VRHRERERRVIQHVQHCRRRPAPPALQPAPPGSTVVVAVANDTADHAAPTAYSLTFER